MRRVTIQCPNNGCGYQYTEEFEFEKEGSIGTAHDRLTKIDPASIKVTKGDERFTRIIPRNEYFKVAALTVRTREMPDYQPALASCPKCKMIHIADISSHDKQEDI